MGVSKKGTAPRLSRVQDWLFVQGVTFRDVFDLTAMGDELLFCHPVFKFIHIQPSKPPLLGDVDLLVAREFELVRVGGLSHMFLVLQLGVDGHYDLATVDPGLCPGAFQKHRAQLNGAWTADSMPATDIHREGLSPDPSGAAVQATGYTRCQGGCSLSFKLENKTLVFKGGLGWRRSDPCH